MTKTKRQCFLVKSTSLFLKKIKLPKPTKGLFSSLCLFLIGTKTRTLPIILNQTLKHTQHLTKKKSLYTDHINFLIKRVGWLVTKIYQHFTFEQSKFKKDFVVMNHKARHKTTTPVERDFYKLLNNSNFGTDCRNNIDNRILEPIYDEISEIAYIKKFENIFDNEKYSQLSDTNIMTQEVNEKYDQLILNLYKTDPTYLTQKYSYESRREEDLETINTMIELKKHQGKKSIL